MVDFLDDKPKASTTQAAITGTSKGLNVEIKVGTTNTSLGATNAVDKVINTTGLPDKTCPSRS